MENIQEPEVPTVPDGVEQVLPADIPPDPVTETPESVEPLVQDSEALVFDLDGKEVQVDLEDVPNLYRSKLEMEQERQKIERERAAINQYAGVLGFLEQKSEHAQFARDAVSFALQSAQDPNKAELSDFAYKVIGYAAKGHTPQEITNFLTQYYSENNIMDPMSPDIAKTQQELQALKQEQMMLRQTLQLNAIQTENRETVNQAWDQLKLEADPTHMPTIANLVVKAAAEMTGDPNFSLASTKLQPRMAKAILAQIKEENPNLFGAAKAKPAAPAVPTVRRVAKAGVLNQIPGAAGVDLNKGVSSDATVEVRYSPRNARESYNTLFG